MKTRFFTFILGFIAFAGIDMSLCAQTPTTTDPIISGATAYNLIYTTGGVDYYATFDPVSYDVAFTPFVPGSNVQALVFTKQSTDATYGNCFSVASLSNNDQFWSENMNWKTSTIATSGTLIPNPGSLDSWKKFYFIKDDVTGLYAIKANGSGSSSNNFLKVPTVSTTTNDANSKWGSTAYFTSQSSQVTIPAQGNSLYCFKLQAAATVDQTGALQSLYNSCLNLYNTAIEGTTIGNYASGSKNTFNTYITNANTVLSSASPTAVQLGYAYGQLSTALLWFRNQVVTVTNGIADGDYYIYVMKPDGTKYYLTDKAPHTMPANGTSKPIDYEAKATGDSLKYQVFKLTYDQSVSRYKIEGQYRLDNPEIYTQAYVSETFSFGGNTYSNAWNTMAIKYDGTVGAIARGGSAGSGYIRPYTSSVGEASVIETSTPSGVPFSYNNSNILNTYIGKSLIYRFEPYTGIPTSISNAKQSEMSAYGIESAIKIVGKVNKTFVYNVTGQLVRVADVNVSSIDLPGGQYIVKMVSDSSTKVVKVIVR